MEDDATLLRQYAEQRSDQAFAELVRRHVNLVYSAALRQVGGDAHLAQDVAQSVFTDLARKAAAVARCPVLAGWLHTSTHYAAAKAVRSEQRRHRREQQAHAMQELLNNSAHDAEWSRLRPVLDVAIKQLSPEDRDAILLRFFEGSGFGVIGARFHLTENAARMRVERALDKLRAQLTRLGIDSTSAALASVLATQAVTAAPTSLALSVTHAALVGATASSAVGSFLPFMAITKTQIAVVAAILLAGGSAVVSQHETQRELQTEISRLHVPAAEIAQLREANSQLARANAERETLQSGSAGLESLRAEIQALRDRAKAAALAASARTADKSASNGARRLPSPEELELMKTLDRVPEIKHRVAPVFPVAMRNAGISGEALVEIIIDTEGKVNGAAVVGSTHRDFEEPALEAVRQWAYDPGWKRGRVVNTRMQIPIVFTLALNEPDWF
ncbi:MAG: TonB family protein [Opitutaceae bacterium]